jgi:hypothetical protein
MKYTDSSGRIFTSYLPNCELNKNLEAKYGSKDMHAFRYYLQQNAEQVMKDLQVEKADCKFCTVCNSALNYTPKGDILSNQLPQ